MNITPQEASALFDAALDVLNNIDNVAEFENHIQLTIPKDEYEALVTATSTIIKGNHRKVRRELES